MSHKVAALGRVIDKFGACLGHLTSLTEDPTVKSVDKQKIKGYVTKWQDSKILFGCAFFYDVLKPCSILSKCLQDEELNRVDAIEAILKTNKSVSQLKLSSLDDLPSVKKVKSRIQKAQGETTYLGAPLANYEQGITFITTHKDQIIESVLSCLKSRIKIQHPDLLTDALILLATQGWEKSEDSLGDVALGNLCDRFRIPLEKAGLCIAVMQEEWRDMLEYARLYLNIVQEPNRVIWWKPFNASCSSKWSNVLGLIELLFCLPLANGHVEHMFSSLKLIKSEKRCSLSEDHLDDLLRIVIDGLFVSGMQRKPYNYGGSKQRRNVGDHRKPPTKIQQSESESDTSEQELITDQWENFVAD